MADSKRHSIADDLKTIREALTMDAGTFAERRHTTGHAAVDRIEEQLEAMQEAIAEAMTSLATGPLRDGYAYACLERVSNPASRDEA